MSIPAKVGAFPRRTAPEPVFGVTKSIYHFISRPGKLKGEMDYWRMQAIRSGAGTLSNDHYQPIMLAMAKGHGEGFFASKVVADFGCGPRGSLACLVDKSVCIGIDVLAGQYLEEFGNEMRKHNMIYVQSTEAIIPLPQRSVDVMFTINAFDHVENLDLMAAEIVRVLKEDGLLIGSFNLDEPATVTEPATLTEESLRKGLFSLFETQSIKIAPKYHPNPYAGHMGLTKDDKQTGARVLWYVGRNTAAEQRNFPCRLNKCVSQQQ